MNLFRAIGFRGVCWLAGSLCCLLVLLLGLGIAWNGLGWSHESGEGEVIEASDLTLHTGSVVTVCVGIAMVVAGAFGLGYAANEGRASK